MRTIIGAITLALGMAATPALAGTAAQPASAAAGAALAGAAPLLAVTSDVAPAGVEAKAAASPFRLDLSLAPTTAATDRATALHHRLGTGMVDLYTAGGDTGFHLSAGSRLFARRNFTAETAASAGGALAPIRALAAATTTRPGFKKFNPALTAGYAMAVSKAARIGVEAGAMMSGAFSSAPGLSRFGVGYRGEHEFRPDAIVNMAFGLRF